MAIDTDLLADTSEDFLDETVKDQYLTFEIDNEEYAVSIAYVREITVMNTITKVPETPDYLEGIVNVRGDIVPIIDVRKRFMKESKLFDESSCIIFIEYKDYYLGLIADAVREVTFIYEDSIVAPPNARLSFHNQFVKNIGKVGAKVKLILDLDRLLLQE